MANFDNIVNEVEKLNALELSELVKALEEKFGVSAAMPMMAPTAVGTAAASDDAEEEQSAFNIELTAAGDQKIAVIKVLRDALGLGLKEAKDLADAAPKVIKEGADKAGADDLKKKLEEAGATVSLK
jgi:large subunit ribosomal protein L7/L12